MRCAGLRAGLLDGAPRSNRPRCPFYDQGVARFLIVGRGEREAALAATLERDGHVVSVLGCERPLSELLAALDHVAVVCWLSAEASPVRFLAGAIDSSMRGLVYRSGDWEREVSETALRNSIPAVSVRAGPDDGPAWEDEVRAAVERLLTGPEAPSESAAGALS